MRRVCCASTRSMSISRGCRERLADRALGDLVEGHAALLQRGDAGRLGDVPGDGLPLAVEVGREVDRVGASRPRGRSRRPACGGPRRRRTPAGSRARRPPRTCPCRGSRAGPARGRTRRARGSRVPDSARWCAPWPAIPRSPGSSSWRASVAPASAPTAGGAFAAAHSKGAVRPPARGAGSPRRSPQSPRRRAP